MAGDTQRRLVFVDAVPWSAAYPADHPLRDVSGWYTRWLADVPGLLWHRVSAEEDVEAVVDGGVRGVVLSGSPRDAWNGDPVNTRLMRLVEHCGTRDIPFLGVCYGHQILARALGGPVGRHPGGLELGNTPVQLTPEGRRSPLFDGLPDAFDVLSSHADTVHALPAGARLLVRGDFTEVQGLAVGDRMFGVQFHPETDPDTLRFLWGPRREVWRTRVRFDLDAVLAALRPTPLASRILRNFITQIAV